MSSCKSNVLALTSVSLMTATLMVASKLDNQKTLLLSDFVEISSVPNWQRSDIGTPVQLGLHLVQLLLLLLEQTLFDSVSREGLQVPGQADLGQTPDNHLGWVVLVPLQGVSVVRGELVVEVVVTFTEGDESSENVVSWGSSVVKWLHTNPVGQRVDTESSLLDETVLQDTAVDETTQVVTPQQTGGNTWQDDGNKEHQSQVVTVSEDHDRVGGQVRNVCSGSVLWVSLGQHPAHVGVPETVSGIVWISVGISVSVVDSVRVAPPLDRALHGTSTEEGEESSHTPVGVVSLVCVESVVACGDGNTGKQVEDNADGHSLELRWVHRSKVQAKDGDGNDQDEVQPVDVLVPVAESPGSVRDVSLLGELQSLSLVLLVEGLRVLGDLLGSDIDQRFGAHQSTTNTGGDDSGHLLVGTSCKSIERGDINAIQFVLRRHYDV